MNNDSPSIYRRVVIDAFRVTLSHTHLWLFGVIVALTGFGSVIEAFIRGYGSMTDRVMAPQSPIFFWKAMPGFETLQAVIIASPYPALSAMIFGFVALAIVVLAASVGSMAVTALISGVRRIIRGGDSHFADGVKAGGERFWPVLLLTVGQKVFISCLIVLGGANLVTAMPYAGPAAMPVYIATYVFLALLVFLVTVVTVYATCFAVIRGLNFSQSLSAGWKLLRDNWLVSVEMLGVLLFLDIIAGALSIVLLVAFASPAVILWSIAAVAQLRGVMWILFVLAAAAAILSAVLLGAFYATLRTSAWTILWSEIAENKPVAKLHRIVAWLKGRRR